MTRLRALPLPRAAPALAAVLFWAVACSVDRDRPTGLELNVPQTEVEVAEPQDDQLVPADSVIDVLVRARGLLQAVELILRRGANRDTLARERRDLTEPEEVVETGFEVRVPDVETGVQLELVGVAENVLGERRDSEPIQVVVIECDEFTVACRDL